MGVIAATSLALTAYSGCDADNIKEIMEQLPEGLYCVVSEGNVNNEVIDRARETATDIGMMLQDETKWVTPEKGYLEQFGMVGNYSPSVICTEFIGSNSERKIIVLENQSD
jgi:hypothetical protein